MFEHRIRQRAYEIHLERERDPALSDWLQAEAEMEKEIERGRTVRSGFDRRKINNKSSN